MQETIDKRLAVDLPGILDNYIDLAKNAEKEAVKERAGRFLIESAKKQERQVQRVPGTTVQILNNLGLPEYRATGGKAMQTIEVGGQKISLDRPVTKRNLVLPESQETKGSKGTYVSKKPDVDAGVRLELDNKRHL